MGLVIKLMCKWKEISNCQVCEELIHSTYFTKGNLANCMLKSNQIKKNLSPLGSKAFLWLVMAATALHSWVLLLCSHSYDSLSPSRPAGLYSPHTLAPISMATLCCLGRYSLHIVTVGILTSGPSFHPASLSFITIVLRYLNPPDLPVWHSPWRLSLPDSSQRASVMFCLLYYTISCTRVWSLFNCCILETNDKKGKSFRLIQINTFS